VPGAGCGDRGRDPLVARAGYLPGAPRAPRMATEDAPAGATDEIRVSGRLPECAGCGVNFAPSREWQQYHSIECQAAARALRLREERAAKGIAPRPTPSSRASENRPALVAAAPLNVDDLDPEPNSGFM
jgi:hypothetical protein